MAGRMRWAGMTVALAALLAGFAVADQPVAPAPAVPGGMVPAAEEGPIRQTEAEAVAQAAATGERVEIGAFRGESREVYANPDGTLTAVDHVQPVRVVRDGRWVPVDATLQRRADGSFEPRAATLGLQLSGGGDDPLVRVERAGRRLALDWPGPLPKPTVDGDRATYAEVLPGVDLVINVTVTGFSHVLVIKTPEAARHPDLATLSFEMGTSGLAVHGTGAGGVAAVDTASGGTVLEAGAPLMWDSGSPQSMATKAIDPRPAVAVEAPPPGAKRAKVSMSVHSGRLTLVPDQAMLTGPGTRWPVYVDPIWQDTRNSGWTMVASGYPNEEYWRFSGTEGLGECPVSSGTCNGVGVKRLYYALPTPFSGKSILSAEFRVTMTHTYDGSAKGVSLYRANSTISSATNWNNKPGLGVLQQTKSPTGTQGSCTSTNQNVGFNATAAVREAASKGWSTTTFGMRAENESDHTAWKRFCGNAILSVHYNRAPSTPKQSDLTMSPGGACVAGTTRPYVDTPPQLRAVLYDPDHSSAHTEQVRAEFKVYWTPAGGSTVTRTYQTGLKKSGSPFTMTVPSDIPEQTVISWEVRASDDTTWGLWSSDGAQTQCEFMYDKTTPSAPDIDSPEYLPADAAETTYTCAEDDEWRGGPGMYGTFTFDSAATDVVEYQYGFNTNPSPNNVLRPVADGGPVSVRWAPPAEGSYFVTVQAIDRARRTSGIASCSILVKSGTPAVAEWSLADAAGANEAADARGAHPATAGTAVTFGVEGPGGPADAAVRLSGTADSYLTPGGAALVDTTAGFSVSAWVKLADVSRNRVAVAQDGSGEPGFTLGFSDGAWAFAISSMDVDALGSWRATGGQVLAGQWTHLVGVYDTENQRMQLYVNGVAQPAVQRRSSWKARGAVQLGRRTAKGGYTDHWSGDLAEVAIFNRPVVAAEVQELSTLRPVRRGYWPLSSSSGERSPEQDGGTEMVLSGATVYEFDPDIDPFGEPALVGSGHLVLDGVDDHAYTEASNIRTDRSFTVTARVRLAATPTRDMVVISQAGQHTSGFTVRCSAAGRWELVLPASDTTGTDAVTVVDDQVPPSPSSAGQHLAVVYNAFTNEARLYVNGQLADSATASHTQAWHADRGLQIGRALVDDTWQHYFAGVVDDVRVYAGVADPSTVQRLSLLTEQPDL